MRVGGATLIYKSRKSNQERGKLIDGPVYAVESPLNTTRAADDGPIEAREFEEDENRSNR